MASDVIKCKSCNIVICELLAFIQNKVDVMDEESIVRICNTSFTVENIEISKKLLFDSLTQEHKKIQRKRSGKAQRDLYDVISIFKQVDPEHVPIFVAKDLNKLPPITFDHVDVTRLLKDILIMQNDVKNIKETYVTENQLIEIKEELTMLKRNSSNYFNDNNINKKRGGSSRMDSFCLNSGPVGLPFVHIGEKETANNNVDVVTADCRGADAQQNAIMPSLSPQCKNTSVQIATSQPVPSVASCKSPTAASMTQVACDQTATQVTVRPKSKTYAEGVCSGGDWKNEDVTQEWKIAQKKRLRNRLVGLEGKAILKPNEKFKAADIRTPLFINNVDINTSEKDILDYVKKKTNILDVTIRKINMKKQKRYNAYKMFVPHHKLSLFLNDEIWPEGIRFRRFIYFNRDKYEKGDKRNENIRIDDKIHTIT